MRRAARAEAALLVALAFVLTGCGTSSAPRLSATAFRSEASALCTPAFVDMAKLKTAIGSASTLALANTAVAHLAARADKLATALGKLNPPQALSKDVTSLITGVHSVSAAMKADGMAYLQQHPDPFVRANQLAISLNLPACSGNS